MDAHTIMVEDSVSRSIIFSIGAVIFLILLAIFGLLNSLVPEGHYTALFFWKNNIPELTRISSITDIYLNNNQDKNMLVFACSLSDSSCYVFNQDQTLGGHVDFLLRRRGSELLTDIKSGIFKGSDFNSYLLYSKLDKLETCDFKYNFNLEFETDQTNITCTVPLDNGWFIEYIFINMSLLENFMEEH